MGGVSLLYPLFLAGMAAASIPIILHLIFKYRRKPILFPTLRFLRITTVRNARRLRLKELLLLVLRVLIFVLLVLAFARPFLRHGASDFWGLGSETRTDLVLVLDDSYSMRRQAPQSESLFEQAKALARERLGSLRSGDRAALVVASEPGAARVALTPNFASVAQAVRALEPSAMSCEYHTAVTTAAHLLASSKAERRLVVLVGDLQQSAWRSLAPLEHTGLPGGMRLEAERVGEAETGNLAVAGLKLPRSTFVEDRPLHFRAKAVAYGRRKWPRFTASLVVNGKEVDRRAVPMTGGVAQVALACSLQRREDISGYVQVDGEDGLALDDRFHFTYGLSDPVRVVCVEQELAAEVHEQESHLLRKALRPVAEGKDDEAVDTGVEPEAVSLGDLDERMIGLADVLVLVNVAGLNGEQIEAIESHVRGGAGLIVFLGDRVNAAHYNERLYASGRGLLPARLEEPWGGGRGSEDFWRLGEVDSAHPVTRLFGAHGQMSLRRVRFFRAYELRPAEGDGALVIARFEDRRPALIEKPFGKGRALLFASSADRSWCDFPKLGWAYVPFVHEMVRRLSPRRVRAAKTLRVGEPIRAPEEWGAAAVTLTEPDGCETALAANEARVTTQPGIHRLSTEGNARTRQIAVNLETSESDTAAATEAEVASLLEKLGGADDGEGAADDRAVREMARESPLWRYLLAIVLGLMLIELAVANLAYRV